ncbi:MULTISPECIES: hypothetical protein [unclassified Pseudofrankia]|uniref:hypothetical protein n=1 Tax=unclassified Pseudofrankia TaxID=2994372 RepID=UPI0008D9C945|nr:MULTISPECIES: hypothetical protein [unclassified Pseudofrankia]MDT3439347.1 hypothetical protein [Pseudofrankia sp. BMG5.37]OHV53758.1 hypothetical protein BCD48_44670 [Pseudofrankia sp. BMG5.36]
MRGLSRTKALVLTAATGASLAMVPAAAASAGTTNNPLTVAGTVRCVLGTPVSLKITGGGESHGGVVGPGGQFSIFFGNPQLPSTAKAEVRCDVGQTRTYPSTTFNMVRPAVGQTLVVNLNVA